MIIRMKACRKTRIISYTVENMRRELRSAGVLWKLNNFPAIKVQSCMFPELNECGNMLLPGHDTSGDSLEAKAKMRSEKIFYNTIECMKQFCEKYSVKFVLTMGSEWKVTLKK